MATTIETLQTLIENRAKSRLAEDINNLLKPWFDSALVSDKYESSKLFYALDKDGKTSSRLTSRDVLGYLKTHWMVEHLPRYISMESKKLLDKMDHITAEMESLREDTDGIRDHLNF